MPAGLWHAMIPAVSEPSLERFYARLLKHGFASNDWLISGTDDDWEAWCAAMEARAERDGILLHRSGQGLGAGSFWVPVMEVARPDGSRYEFATASGDVYRAEVRAMERDWGERLEQARLRAGPPPSA
jgi:hypothetical protein